MKLIVLQMSNTISMQRVGKKVTLVTLENSTLNIARLKDRKNVDN